jgi:hypothetical protein
MLMKVNDKNLAWFTSAIFIFLAVIGLSYFFFTAPEEASPNTFETDSSPPVDGVVRSPDEKVPEQQIARGEEGLDANNPTISAVTKNGTAISDEIQSQNDEESLGFSSRIKKILDEGKILDTQTQFEEGSEVKRLLIQSKIHETPIIVVERRNGAGQVRHEAYHSDQIIVKVREGLSISELESNLEQIAGSVRTHLGGDLYSVILDRADIDSAQDAIAFFASSSEHIVMAEVDGIGFGAAEPNDPLFYQLWHLQNTGYYSNSVDDVDVDATEFWQILPDGPEVVIGILDSGIDMTHPDLQGVLWKNPNEIADDGIDNDGNGYVDDVVGWDFVNDDNNPNDDTNHGTRVTGVIAANIGNSTGVAGLLPNPVILPCKIFNENNTSSGSDVLRALAYLDDLGVSVINYSGGGHTYSNLWIERISELEESEVILTFIAGNEGLDTEVDPYYPQSYDHPNIISVGGHHHHGGIVFSYGSVSVDLFAPARYIQTTENGGGYTGVGGTSYAAPLVAATAAAIKRIKPDWTAADIKQAILGSVVKDDIYEGLCVSGGRLNAHNALLVANAIDDGRNDVQSEPSSYSLHTAAEIISARTNGQEDVTSDPNTFDLYTYPQVSAVATIYRGYGQDDVTSDPATYSLHTASEVTASRTAGQNDVTSDPSSYSLYTADNVSTARTAGQNDVTSDPATYSLYTASEVTTARTTGQTDVTSDPATYDLFTQTQLDARAESTTQAIILNPSSAGLFAQTDLDAASAAATSATSAAIVLDPASVGLFSQINLDEAISAATQAIILDPSTVGLFASQEAIYFSFGQNLIELDKDSLTLDWSLMRTEDLSIWEEIGKVEIAVPKQEAPYFFRFELNQ